VPCAPRPRPRRARPGPAATCRSRPRRPAAPPGPRRPRPAASARAPAPAPGRAPPSAGASPPGGPRSGCRPGRSRRAWNTSSGPAKPLRRVGPERAQLEHVADGTAGAVGDHHRPWRRHLLQPRGQVRASRRPPLSSRPAPSPTRSPTPTSPLAIPTLAASGSAAGVSSKGTASMMPSPALDRALGVVLMRLGPAEVGQHAVAHELRHVAPEARHRARDRGLVRPQDPAHLLRVEPAREGGGAD
jgi:hypothetical protein